MPEGQFPAESETAGKPKNEMVVIESGKISVRNLTKSDEATVSKTMHCTEDTGKGLNKSGIKVSPFVKVAFFDMAGGGLVDMIAGGKDGLLYLYENAGDSRPRHWELKNDYFEGIKTGAFSSPAVGDIDGDGIPEIVVGTGGFSADSGRLLFFKNYGTMDSPRWRMLKEIDIRIGNDASVAIIDYNFDGKPDIIAGNSEGEILFFKNASDSKKIRFVREKSPLNRRSFGMYAVPAAVKVGDKMILMIGNAMGRLFMFEIKKLGGHLTARELKVSLATRSFASPSFADLSGKKRFDLVLADGDGGLTYYRNKMSDFTVWEKDEETFNNGIMAGPACAPTVCSIGSRTYMVIGNIDGTLRCYEYDPAQKFPWTEKRGYFRGIKVSGFSRGVLTQWDRREVLVSGQENGTLRAFIRKGSEDAASWEEIKGFFQGIPLHEHSTPVIFDIDDNGQRAIITGSADGRVYAYRIKELKDGLPLWEEIKEIFDNVKVDSFSTPAIARDKDILYLFVGEQDGRIKTYRAGAGNHKSAVKGKSVLFHDSGYIKDFRMNNHSSPFITARNGIIELVSGDYDGNLRHFICNETVMLTGQ